MSPMSKLVSENSNDLIGLAASAVLLLVAFLADVFVGAEKYMENSFVIFIVEYIKSSYWILLNAILNSTLPSKMMASGVLNIPISFFHTNNSR
jgi:hypothetical protein